MNASWLIFCAFDYGTFFFFTSLFTFFLLPPPSLIRLVLNYILNYDETCYGWVVLYTHKSVRLLSRVRFPALIFILLLLRLMTLNYRAAKNNCLGHKLVLIQVIIFKLLSTIITIRRSCEFYHRHGFFSLCKYYFILKRQQRYPQRGQEGHKLDLTISR